MRTLPALIACLLAGCILQKESNRGSVVDNEVRVGTIRLADGTPAANARVRIFPVDHVPDSTGLKKVAASPAFTTHTDSKGRYQVDSLPKGEYNILGDLDGDVSYSDSVFIAATTGSLPTDTLDEPGSLAGIVGMEPNHDPRTTTVQVLGTHIFANVDAKGRFRLDQLAAGKYRLRLVTTVAEYTPLFVDASGRSGKSDTLSDTLRLTYTGIPVVRGLRADFDTAQGRVRLSWQPSDYIRLADYMVYRDVQGSLEFSKTPIGRTTDTSFIDSVMSPTDTGNRKLEYRVRIRSLGDEIGPIFGAVHITAQPRSLVATSSSLSALDAAGKPFIPAGPRRVEITVHDTAYLVIRFANPTRKIADLTWAFSHMGMVRNTKPDRREGADTLRFISGDKDFEFVARVEFTDIAGSIHRDSIVIETETDAPLVVATGDSVVGQGDTLHLGGTAKDRGRIVKWEWDIGNSGTFKATSGPDTNLIAPARAYNLDGFQCVLRATDDDGNTSADTVHSTVSAWRRMKSLPTARKEYSVAALGGKIYVVGGRAPNNSLVRDLEAYDPATDTWKTLAPIPTPRYGGGAFIAHGKLHVTGGHNGILLNETEAYDPATDSWSPAPDIPTKKHFFSVVTMGGKVYAFEGQDLPYQGGMFGETNWVDVYDTATRTWSTPTYRFADVGAPSRNRPNGAAYKDQFITLDYDKMMHRYIPSRNRVEITTGQGIFPYKVLPFLTSFAGSLYVLSIDPIFPNGPSNPWYRNTAQAWLFDPDAKSWTPRSAPLWAQEPAALVEVDGKIYAVGGWRSTRSIYTGDIVSELEMYDPSLDP